MNPEDIKPPYLYYIGSDYDYIAIYKIFSTTVHTEEGKVEVYYGNGSGYESKIIFEYGQPYYIAEGAVDKQTFKCYFTDRNVAEEYLKKRIVYLLNELQEIVDEKKKYVGNFRKKHYEILNNLI